MSDPCFSECLHVALAPCFINKLFHPYSPRSLVSLLLNFFCQPAKFKISFNPTLHNTCRIPPVLMSLHFFLSPPNFLQKSCPCSSLLLTHPFVIYTTHKIGILVSVPLELFWWNKPLPSQSRNTLATTPFSPRENFVAFNTLWPGPLLLSVFFY